jgi:hypothetical protein
MPICLTPPRLPNVASDCGPQTLRFGLSDQQTVEVGVTGLHQNAAAGHRRDDAAKSARAPISDLVAGGAFCHADLRVCRADSPKRSVA